MLSITYALAEEKDTPLLVDYRIRFLDEISGERTDEERLAIRQQMEYYFPKAIAEKSYISLLAKIENNVVAQGALMIIERPANYNCPNGKLGYILNMYTVPAYRKQGICRAILEQLIEIAKQ